MSYLPAKVDGTIEVGGFKYPVCITRWDIDMVRPYVDVGFGGKLAPMEMPAEIHLDGYINEIAAPYLRDALAYPKPEKMPLMFDPESVGPEFDEAELFVAEQKKLELL